MLDVILLILMILWMRSKEYDQGFVNIIVCQLPSLSQPTAVRVLIFFLRRGQGYIYIHVFFPQSYQNRVITPVEPVEPVGLDLINVFLFYIIIIIIIMVAFNKRQVSGQPPSLSSSVWDFR